MTETTSVQHPDSIPGPSTPGLAASGLTIERGVCHVLFAYDVGMSIELDEAERRIQATSKREKVRRRRKAPAYFEYHPAPLRITIAADSIPLGEFVTDPSVDMVIYDFGAVSVTYRVPLRGPLERLIPLGEALYDHEGLLEGSRRCVDQLLNTIAAAVSKPRVADLVEDYAIYQIERFTPAQHPATLLDRLRLPLAQVMRAESGVLSPNMIDDALGCRISFSEDDLTFIDWNAAWLFDADAEDVITVLEYANVELLEMRYLDDQLDQALEESYEAFSRFGWVLPRRLATRSADLRRVAEWQLDSALLFEGVNNALKLLGDQYLARVYQLAVQRLHIDDWDASIIRKLNTLESIYEKMSDQQSSRRMEVLEWIIILLIAVSIVLPFVLDASH